MKVKYILFSIFFSLFAFSCSREEEESVKLEENYPLLMKLDSRILDLSAPIILPDYNFYFEYNDQKLTKKIGGYVPTAASTGVGGVFSTKVFTSLVYQDNKVTVEDFSNTSEFTILKNSKYFTLNNSNKIIQKEVPDRTSIYWYKKQSFIYKNEYLDEIKTTLPNMPFDPNDPNDYVVTFSEKFYFDNSGNLVKTEYFEQHNGINTENKIVRIFSDYDSSLNPFKRFTLLDEYFYRSLSKNNFRDYKEYDYHYSNIPNVNTRNWTFNYDAKGNIILN